MRLLIYLILLLVAVICKAEEQPHLDFMGTPIEGSISDWSKSVQQRYKVQKKMNPDNYFILRGPVYGHEMYVKAECTKKSRTVFRLTVTPQFIDQTAFLDSLCAHHGEPERTEQGYAWKKPEGMVFMYQRQGYDPVLIYLDNQGIES